MKAMIGAVAVLGALAAGGVPAVAFTAGNAERDVTSTAAQGTAKDKPAKPAKHADKLADGKPGWGPPAHAHSSHNLGGSARKDNNGSARKDEMDHAKPKKHAEMMSSLGRAHGQAMRAWSGCVSERAAGEDPVAACGQKPVPPGHLKRRTAAP